MDGETPLLKSVGYQSLIETMTPEDVLLATDLLSPFLKDFIGVEIKKIAVLAYLFGVKQGYQELTGGVDGKYFENKMLKVYEMGKQHGLHHMAILLGAEPMFSPKFFFGHKLGGGNADGKPTAGKG